MRVRRLFLAGLAIATLAGCATSSTQSMKISIPPSTNATARQGAEFHLRRPWQREPDAAFRPTLVRLAWSPKALLVEAEITDDEVTTKATADNQRMWELGDVFEAFMQIEGRRDYVELHLTPNNKRMHLHYPGVGGKASVAAVPLTIEQMLVRPVGFASTVKRTPTGWRVMMSIPASVFRIPVFHPGLALRVSFCRYDAAATGEPVLSTTADHPVIAFHRPHEWTTVRLVE